MRPAHVDPEELRKFANSLKKFNDNLQKDVKQLKARFRALESNAWKDQVHDRFAQEFEETMRVIAKFIKHSEEHVPFLRKKAQVIEGDYFGR